MAVRSGVLAVVASVLLLAGCASVAPMPEPMTQAEAEKLVDENNRIRWDQMFPGEPMPDIAPIKYLEAGASWTEITECLRDANLEGVTFNLDGTADRTIRSTPERERAENLAGFICQLKYPVDMSDPGQLGYLTDEQLEWIWNYNAKRLVPCLQQLGFFFPARPEAFAVETNAYWVPYFDMTPVPASDKEWALIDQHCPPSPIGPSYQRPTMG